MHKIPKAIATGLGLGFTQFTLLRDLRAEATGFRSLGCRGSNGFSRGYRYINPKP